MGGLPPPPPISHPDGNAHWFFVPIPLMPNIYCSFKGFSALPEESIWKHHIGSFEPFWASSESYFFGNHPVPNLAFITYAHPKVWRCAVPLLYTKIKYLCLLSYFMSSSPFASTSWDLEGWVVIFLEAAKAFAVGLVRRSSVLHCNKNPTYVFLFWE